MPVHVKGLGGAVVGSNHDYSAIANPLRTALGKFYDESKPKSKGVRFSILGDDNENSNEPVTLSKSLDKLLLSREDNVLRLAFESDPQHTANAGVYRHKRHLLADVVLKRMATQESLVAAIVAIRSNHIASFGRPRPDRFSTGYVCEPRPGVLDRLDEDGKKDLDKRIEGLIDWISTCGKQRGYAEHDRRTFAQFLYASTRDAVVVGRVAAEVVKNAEGRNHSFRVVDAGTIFQSAYNSESITSQIRSQAKIELQRMRSNGSSEYSWDEGAFERGDYTWVQVIHGNPKQVFTDKELLVHYFYPVSDVDLDGYPLTPLDTIVSQVTTRLNITTHNKMYFAHGRASRGMLVFKSGELDPKTANRIRQQFNATLNSVNNAFKTPVFAMDPQDSVEWVPVENQGGRDMEFQFLSDDNARAIMAAFQISPDEVPGLSHLSRGSNAQSLSESNNEYKLQAARDVGIRPLLNTWESFINERLLPVYDPELADMVRFRFAGLEAETAERESVRLSQDSPVHLTQDEILEKVEKQPLGAEWGGDFLLSPSWQQTVAPFLTVGEILEHFFHRKGAAQDPMLNYRRDPFWFQQVQLQMAMQQQQQAMAQAQQQAQQGPPQDQGQPQQGQDQGQGQPQEQPGDELASAADNAIGEVSKSEKSIPSPQRRVLRQHRQTVDKFMAAWDEDVKEMTAKILDGLD